MIFREMNGKLYKVNLGNDVNEDEFLRKQKNSKTKFLKIDIGKLPIVSGVETYYKISPYTGKVIIDWDRTNEEIKTRISQIAVDIVQKRLKEYDYENEGEVALYAFNLKSKWNKEAKELQKWIEAVYQKMYDLQDKVDGGEVSFEDIRNELENVTPVKSKLSILGL